MSKLKIFVSYAHKNTRSRDFIDMLELKVNNGYFNKDHTTFELWTDRHINPGDEWQKEIDQKISESFAIVVLITPESVQSHYVTYEWAFAIGLKKVVIPIVLETSSGLHERLQAIQWADISAKPSLASEIDPLIGELERRYQSQRQFEQFQESQRVAQLIYSSLDHSSKQRGVGDFANALQALHAAESSINKFTHIYGKIYYDEELSNPLWDLLDDVYYDFGHTYFLLDKYNEAENYFEKALNYNPNHVYSHIDLGIIARKKADSINSKNSKERKQYLESAHEYFEKALQLQEGILDYEEQSLWASLGGICKRQGRLEDAIKHYQKAIEHKKSSYPYNNLGLLHFELDQAEEMIANFRVALSFAKAQLRIKPDDNWAPCDELIAQIVLNQSGHADEKLDSIIMERMVDHVIRVSPIPVLKRIRSVLQEIIKHNEKYKKSKRKKENIIDVDSANSALKQVEAKLGTASQKI